MTFLDILRLGRVHTVALPAPFVLFGYYLATGSWDPGPVLFWVTWYFTVHFAGMVSNNLCDLRYDRLDAHKQHFPLVSGRVSRRAAILTCVLLHVPALGMPVLAFPRTYVLLWTLIAFTGAWAYNLSNKVMRSSPVFYLLFVAGMPLIPYLSYQRWLSQDILLLTGIAVTIVAYQLLIEGPLKDAGAPQTPYDWNKVPVWGKAAMGFGFRTATMALCIALNPSPYIFLVGIFVVGFGTLVSCTPRSLKVLGVNNIMVYTMALLSMDLGALATVLFLVIPIAWYTCMNRLLWGSWTTPAV